MAISKKAWGLLFVGLAGLGVACDPEPGPADNPHACAPEKGCAPTKKDDKEGRYRITATGLTHVDKFRNGPIFINHNARGEFFNERIKRRLPEVNWSDTVRAPESRAFTVIVQADSSPPGQLFVGCQIEVLGGPRDGMKFPAHSGSGGNIHCDKPAGV